MLVCVVQVPQSGKSYSLFASVTGQLTTETFRLGIVSLDTSVLSASCENIQCHVSFGWMDGSTFATLQWRLFLRYLSMPVLFAVL